MDVIATTAASTAEGSTTAKLESADYAVIAVYFVFILGVGIWAMMKTDRSNVDGFFLAGRNIGWFPVGASLFSSNIGSGSFVGLAGTGAAAGIAVGAFEWNAMFCLFLLGWIFAPIYITSGVVTMPEYLSKRYGGERIQMYISILSLLLYILTKVSSDLFSGAIFIQVALGWNLYLSIIILLVITGLYTITGGLAAVIYTDTVQTFIMLGGAIVMMVLAFQEIGGYSALEEKYFAAIPTNRPNNSDCGIPREDAFHVFRDAVDGDLPWPGLTFGLTIIASWYWCADQVIAQRTLAARNLSHAKGGCIMAGLLKILPMYMSVMVGMVSRILFTDEIACATPEDCMAYCGTSVGCSNLAYPTLVVEIMPVGLKGLLLAAMIAALMSSLTSVFNSASTLFTCDLWQKFRREASERELMIVGRVFMLFMVGISIAWVPLVQSSASGQLFDYIQSITSYLSPPIIVVFALGIFWPRLNEPGAFWSLMIGLCIGVIRMVMDFILGSPLCSLPDSRPHLTTKFHYLYFAMLLAVITLFNAIFISLVTPAINKETQYRLTWYTRFMTKDRVEIDQYRLKKAMKKFNDVEDKHSEHSFNEANDGQKQSWFKKGLLLFCGLNKASTESAASQPPPPLTSIKEKKSSSRMVDIGCLAMLSVCVFLFGYYG